MKSRLEIFFGAAAPTEARVYVQLHGAVEPDTQLAGTLHGPFSKLARTLPARVSLVDLGPGPTPLAQAVVPDPCFWTPESPFYYTVEVEVRRAGQAVETAQRMLGIRPLAVDGRDLRLAARRFVVRGVFEADSTDEKLANWHVAGAARYAIAPDDALCAAASEEGVLLLAAVEGPPHTWQRELDRLAQWPAVGTAIVPDKQLPADLKRPRNLLLAQEWTENDAPPSAPWADLVVCPADQIARLTETGRRLSIPVVAVRRLAAPLPIDVARTECDRLQRDLAPYGNLAGYIV